MGTTGTRIELQTPRLATVTRRQASLIPAARWLTVRPDARGQLYAVDATKWLEYCRGVLNCEVDLVTNYGLSEFTILAKISSA